MEQVIVEKRGSDGWPRYVIKDNLDRFWTGEGWSDESKAVLFDDENRAMKAALELCLDSKLRHFTTTINVFVEGDGPITVEQLRRFLEANCFVWLGNDGSDEAFERLRVDVDAAWDDLEEVE